jgi:hypothetical protein
MPDNHLREKGVIYYATGQKYLEDAEESARSLKEHNNLHITVFTDVDNIETKVFDNIEKIDPGEHPFYDRINYFKKSPYQKTLHLDTDTYITGDITPIFEMLNRFDVVAAINENRDTVAEDTKFETVDLNIPDAFPEYQCGVIGFSDSTDVMELLEEWQSRYSNYKDKNVLDQPFFRKAVYNNENIQLGTLPSEYNLLVNFPGYLQQSARIIHFGGTGRANPEKLVKKINAEEGKQRVYYEDFKRKITVRPKSSFRYKAVRSIYRNGFYNSFKKFLQHKLER